MPLIVECPSGCEIRVSRQRAGKIIRCPQCTTAIRLPGLMERDFEGNQTIHCVAKVARRKQRKQQNPIVVSASESGEFDSQEDFENQTNEIDTRVGVCPPKTKKQPRISQGLPAPPPTPSDFHNKETFRFEIDPSKDLSVVADETWEVRLESANSDRQLLARFYAACIFLLGIVNIIPSIQHGWIWFDVAQDTDLFPVWIYLQVLIACFCFVYALYLMTLPVWPALRAVAVAMLGVAFVFGFVATGLLTGSDERALIHFLGVPFSLSRQAAVWCLAMLCLAIVMAYWGGKESIAWERSEKVLEQIVKQ